MPGAGSLLRRRPYCPHAARPTWRTASALLLLALLLSTGCMAEQTLGAHALKGVNAFVPLCRTLTANLRPKDFKELSALVQQHLHKGKVVSDTSDLLHMVRHPPEEEKTKHAYKTTKTVQELEVILMEAQRDEQLFKTQLEALIARLQEARELPEGAIKIEDVTHCVSTGLDPRLYPYRPKVSFLLQYFKRPHVIDAIVARLRTVQAAGIPCELVVNVDNPDEHQQWAELSYSTDGFVVPVFSANVHEARAYNRIAAVARGDFLVFLQDDELPPEEGRDPWVHRMVQTFEKYPRMGVVGFQSFRYCPGTCPNFYQAIYYKDPELGHPMSFAAVVDFAPLAARATAFENVGGLDEGISDAGVCGIYSDWELCMRMWAAGWQVSYGRMEGKEKDRQAESGTHLPETGDRCWGRQGGVAARYFTERWKPLEPEICKLVEKLNNELLAPSNPSQPPPYRDGKCSQ